MKQEISQNIQIVGDGENYLKGTSTTQTDRFFVDG